MLDADTFAALICDWCLEVTPGQTIMIHAPTLAAPLIDATQAAVLAREAWPYLALSLPGQEERLLEHARDRQLDGPNPAELSLAGAIDASLRVIAPVNTRGLSGVDPARLARVATAQRPLRERMLAKRWALTIWPTDALAQEAGMSSRAYEEFVGRALKLDQPDPVAAWRELSRRQAELVSRLAGAREVRIRSERTDITLEVTGRRWQNSDGRRNMPSGEVFTSPHETSANGHIHFDVPSNRGVEVAGVTLSFVDGVVTEAHAERGDDFLQAQLATDPGARRLGEIGIGTNTGIDRATGSTLLDEKIGGTIHLALGRSYPECGGVNESAIHWDLVCDLRSGGVITVDGEVLSADGVFV